ncbi:MAG: rhomboid family intramembrane serine protease [Promethearchaeota archaeon]|jgi:membrane associated rhomboid family serine protease
MLVLDAENLKDAKITITMIFLNIFCFLIFNVILPPRYFLLFVQINRNILFDYEIWRLMTPIFLHGNEVHLISNLIALLLFGASIETNRSFSKLKFLLIYFLSGFIGNLFSLVLLPINAISLGSSGAIFGLIGVALLIIARENRALLPFALLYIGYFIFASFMPGINIWAHLFGLFGGLLFGYFFYYRKSGIELDY